MYQDKLGETPVLLDLLHYPSAIMLEQSPIVAPARIVNEGLHRLLIASKHSYKLVSAFKLNLPVRNRPTRIFHFSIYRFFLNLKRN